MPDLWNTDLIYTTTATIRGNVFLRFDCVLNKGRLLTLRHMWTPLFLRISLNLETCATLVSVVTCCDSGTEGEFFTNSMFLVPFWKEFAKNASLFTCRSLWQRLQSATRRQSKHFGFCIQTTDVLWFCIFPVSQMCLTSCWRWWGWKEPWRWVRSTPAWRALEDAWHSAPLSPSGPALSRTHRAYSLLILNIWFFFFKTKLCKRSKIKKCRTALKRCNWRSYLFNCGLFSFCILTEPVNPFQCRSMGNLGCRPPVL